MLIHTVAEDCDGCDDLTDQLDALHADLDEMTDDLKATEGDLKEMTAYRDSDGSELAALRDDITDILEDIQRRISMMMVENPFPVMANEEVLLRAIRDSLSGLLT